MKATKRNSTKNYIALALIGLALFSLWFIFTAAMPRTPGQQLNRAWRLANDVSSYAYRSSAVQTNYPSARLDNAGRSPEEKQIWAEGTVDRPNKTMTMKLSLGANQQPIELKIENGQAFGKTELQDKWVAVDNPADVFAPNGDPLGYLIAAENIQYLGRGQAASKIVFDSSQSPVSGSNQNYTFDINGAKYANYIRQQLEETLRASGELPAGVSLKLADQYINMKAYGEIWTDANGLPVRQVIHMEFPTEQDAYNNVEADITTTFSRWDTASLEHQIAWVLPRIVKNPSILLDDPLSLLPNIDSINLVSVQVISIEIGLILLLAAFILLAYSRFGSRGLFTIVIVLVISSLLASPLIESNRVLAFSEKQQDKISEVEQQKSEQLAGEQIQSSLQESDFNPTVDPLAVSSVDVQSLPANTWQSSAILNASSVQAPQLQTTCTNPVPGDIDCNGNPDNDGDGLTDEVEVLKLGTDPNNVDTDGDRISDKVEVQGFDFGGQHWYLDPLNPDTNLDGRSDFLECTNQVDVAADGTWPIAQLGSACNNSDDDTTPDVFDFDDDNDGVPDSLDSAPTYTGDLSATTRSDVSLDLSSYVTDKTLLVDFELRPADPNNLWQTGNVYDWPSDDRAGQITRVFDTTFADVSTSSNPPANLSTGDVMLTPMLQIKMASPASNTGNPSSSLPVKSTFSGDITTAALDDWLDSDMLNQYSIGVSQDDSDGSLYAYVPLLQLNDPVGDAPVAWTGRMAYLPNTTSWGQAHQVKLIWLVTMLIDTCDTTGLSNPKDQKAYSAWCDGTTHWTTQEKVVQTYYEDFKLTGLNVTEEHGSKTAVIAQTDALSTHYERNLWQLSNGLQGTFITGDQISSGNRFTIEEIKNRFDAGTTSYATGAPELWGIPNNKLVVREASSVDQVTSFKDLEANVNALLNDMYRDAATGSIVTLMFAREDSSRSVMLEETDHISVNGNAISIDLGATSDNPVFTYASLNWAPYRIDVAGWHGYDVVDYLLLDAFTSALKTQLTPADLQTMASGETISDANLAKEGALLFAQNYYLAISRGLADMVAVNGQPLSDDMVADGDYALNGQEPVAKIVGDMVDLMATFVETERDLMVNGSVVANSNFDTANLRSLLLESASNGKDVTYFKLGSKVTFSAIEWSAKKLFKKVNNFSKTTPGWGKLAKKGGKVLALSGTAIKLLGPTIFKGMTQRQALVTAASLDTAASALSTVGAYSKVYKLSKLTKEFKNSPDLSTAAKVFRQTHAIKEVVKAGAVTSVITDTLAAIGLMAFAMISGHVAWGSIQANLLLAETIATITVNIVLTVISLTAIGALFVAIFALIDSVMGLICDIRNVDPNSDVRKWACGGVTGAAAQGISNLIYDYYTPYDVTNKDRLDVVFDSVTVVKNTANDGFVAGNALKLDATITNNFTMAEPDRLIIRTSYLNSNLTLDRERLKNIGEKSTFDYSLNTTPPNHPEDALSLNGTTWNGDIAVYSKSQTVTLEEGMNVTPSIYLTEAYDLATIECWGFVGADESATCNENKELKGSNNTDVSGLFVFDVLPTSISGIPAFFNKLKSQRDADGDGLPSSGSGLVDPNSSTWDTDQDGLSDYWEMNHAGFNPQSADSDGDGLYDYWEAFYQTQPGLQDSDSDGLGDAQEFFHSNARSAYQTDNSTWSGGWNIVYGYSGSVSQQTRVSADPQSVDFDADNILDSLEYTYGYNPNLPSIENVLTLNAKPDANIYLPGSTINYNATVKNELDNRVAYGLLETEFPVDVLLQQQVINALYPQVETGLSGSVTASNAGQTITQDLVVRAGALINTSAADAVFDLPFDGTTASTAFRDITAGHHDFTCTACPTVNGGTVTFSGSQSLARAYDADFDRSIFSVSAWVKPTANGGTLYEVTNDVKIEQLGSGAIRLSIEGQQLTSDRSLTLNSWNYVVVSYNAGSATIFINSIKTAASTSMGSITPSNNGSIIGSGFRGDMDRIVLQTSALTQEDILDVYNGLSFYASFDDGVRQQPWDGGSYCGFKDLITQQSFDCDGVAKAKGEKTDTQYVPRWNAYYTEIIGYDIVTTVTPLTVAIAPKPDVFNGVVGKSINLYHYDEDFAVLNETYKDKSNYLHFDHPVSLAGTVTGKNDNAFSIALWLDPASGAYFDNDFSSPILTLPDQNGVDGTLAGSTDPMWYTAGDGSQVRVWARSDAVNVNVGGCSARIGSFWAGIGWHHLGIAYNGVDTLNLYKDGILASSTACLTTTDFKTVNGFTLGYSSLNNTPIYKDYYLPMAFWGSIDELRFYNRALTGGEMQDLYSGALANFNFDGRTGQTFFANSSPNGVYGTCSGASCPVSGLPSIDNQGLKFDGNDYVELSNSNQNLADGSFTVMTWVKGKGGLFSVMPDNSNQWLYMGLPNGKPKVYWTGSNGVEAPNTVGNGQWHHLAFRYQKYQKVDGEDQFLGKLSIFVDGTLVASSTNNLAFNGTGTPRIGFTPADKFTGMIDNLSITNYAFTDDQIRAYMDQVPVLNLHLDEGLENVLQNFSSFKDDSQNSLIATCNSASDECPAAGSRGKMREAVVFDGGDMLTIPDNSALDLDTFSVGMWVKPGQEKSTSQPLLVKQSDANTNQNYGLFIKPNSMQVQYGFYDACTTSISGESIGSLNKNQWNHIMLTYDKTALKIYINGTLQGSTPSTGSPCNSNDPIRIGKTVSDSGFEGSLDEITLHKVALSDAEIRDLYNYQLSWYDISTNSQITIDADFPQINLGGSNGYVNLEARQMSLSAYDIGSGVKSVTVEITDPQRNTTTQDAIRGTETNSISWFYTFAPTQKGRYTVKVTATDNVGHTSAATRTFEVDSDGPVFNLGATYDPSTKSLLLGGEAHDGGYPSPRSEVDTTTLQVDIRARLNNRYIAGPVPVNATPNPNESFLALNGKYPFPVIPYGLFDYVLTGADKVGNTSSFAYYYQIDGMGPIADVVTDANVLGDSTPTITGTATDAGYGLTGQQTIFHFEEADDAVKFIDGSAKQAVATCAVPACPTGSSGRFGKSFTFDGVDDWLDAGTTPSISGTGSLAVSAWIRTSANADQVILQQRSNTASDGQYQLSLTAEGKVRWLIEGSEGLAFDATTAATVNDGAWHHILAQRDGVGTGSIYIDGELAGLVAGSARTLLDANVSIGADGISNDKFFNGALDEVTIYGNYLQNDEIYYLANPLESYVHGVQVRFRSYAERDLGPDEGTWYPATITNYTPNFANWSLDLPALSSGNYKIDLKATDGTTTRYIGEAWTGAYTQQDLQITATPDVSDVAIGGQVSYTVTYANDPASADTAPNTVVSLSIPANGTLNAALSDPNWSCLPDTGNGITCTYLVGMLAPGAGGTIPTVVDVLPQITSTANVASTFTISALGAEQSPSDNSVTVTTPITGTFSNLAISISDNGGLDAYGQLNYTLTVSNTGNQAATAVLTETIPDATQQVPYNYDTPWQCTPDWNAGSTCVYNAGLVNGGESITVPFIVYIPGVLLADVPITNTAQVSMLEGGETDLSDNTASLDTLLTGGIFGVDSPTVTVKEGDIATNGGVATCVGACEFGVFLNSGPGTLADFNPFYPDYDTRWNWSFTTTDGPNETGYVVLRMFGGSFTKYLTFSVVVENVPPTISLTGNDNYKAGIPYTLTLGNVVDPGQDTVSACTIKWGDGNSEDCFNAIGGGSLSHTFATDTQIRTITVDLTDEDGSYIAAGTKIIAGPTPNVAPEFDPISAQTVAENDTLTFSAIATDANGDNLTYSLESAPVGATIDPNTGLFSWTPDELDGPGDHAATIVVTDGLLSNSVTVLITVTEVNVAPVFTAMSDPTIGEGDTLSINVVATDSDFPAQALTYSLTSAPTGASIDPVSGLLTWITSESDGPGQYPITVEVTDGELNDSQTITVTVDEVNSAPVMDPIDGQTVTSGDTVTFTATASDTDLPAQALIYSLSDAPAGAVIDPNTGVFSWDSGASGLYIVTVTVSDGLLTDSQNVSIYVQEGSVAPVLFPLDAQTVLEGETVNYQVNAYDANGDTITYSLSGAPADATIDSATGKFSWVTTENDGPGVYSITVVVSDGVLEDSADLSVTVIETNTPPFLPSIPELILDEGNTLSVSFAAQDADVPAQVLTYSLSNAPAGAAIDPNSGLLTWPTTETDGPGVYSATITVSDGELTDSQTTSITVNEVNIAPTLDPISDQSVDEGQTVSFTATATDIDVPAQTLTYSLSDAPAGATIDPVSGLFTWTANTAGDYQATIIVSDGEITDSLTIKITVNSNNQAPVVSDIPDQTIAEGATFAAINLDDYVSDADNSDSEITWSYSGNVDLSVSIDGNRIATVTTPNSSWIGTETIIFRATDPGAMYDETAVVFTVEPAPTITTQPQDQTIFSGQTATLSVVASGSSLSYQWYQGTSGNSSTPVGTDSASFTTPALTADTSYWVRVSNLAGSADSNTATITVEPAPTITTQPQSQIIASGQTATLSVVASGSSLSYQWYQGVSSDTSTPVGSDSDTFTTPALTADTNYWVRVSNPAGNADSDTATITIGQPPTITSADSTTFTEGVAGSFTITTAAGIPTATTLSESGALPVGVSFIDNDDGTATLSGTPAFGTFGTYNLSITASNGIAPDATQDFTLNILPATVQVTVGTDPSGLSFTVDGTTYTSAQTLTWNVGSSHTLAASSPQAGTPGMQYAFDNWSDGGALSHSVTAPATDSTYTVTFKTQYELTTAVNPDNGGSVSPASGTYYDANTDVSLTATANSGFTFLNWTGNVADAAAASTTITMSGPQSVTANFKASTLLLYNGDQLVNIGDNVKLAAQLSSPASACTSGQTIDFSLDVNPLDGSAGPYSLGSATTAPDGQTTLSVSTSGWQEGIYDITASFAGTTACDPTSDDATLTAASPGNSATGGGWYPLPGSGHINFGFNVRKVDDQCKTDCAYKGQLLLINNGKWRLKGTLDSYVKTSTSQGAASGTGNLYWWDPSLNDGLGDWSLAQSAVSFTINFYDSGQTGKGKGNKSTDSDTFGINIQFTPVSPPQPNSLPNSDPQPLKGGNIQVN